MTTAISLCSIELVPDDTEDESAMLSDLKGHDVAATDERKHQEDYYGPLTARGSGR